MSMGMGMSQRQEQSLSQTQTLKQTLALRLAQKLKITIKQLLKLYPQLAMLQNLEQRLLLDVGDRSRQQLRKLIENSDHFYDFLKTNPTQYELKKEFPGMERIFNDAYNEQYHAVQKQKSNTQIGMRMEMRQGLSQTQRQTQSMSLPNWSFVDAYKTGKKDSDFPKGKIPEIDAMPLEERLKKIDEANALFRFVYVKREEYERNTPTTKYYKVPLVRNSAVDELDVQQQISKQEFEQAKNRLSGVKTIDRIARAIPYTELHFAVKDIVESKGATMDDVVLIGIDRGGRIPALIVRESIGKDKAYFLKVDQGGGKIDTDRLLKLGQNGTLKDKFILFVDSTVDSGRQITALENTLSHYGHFGFKGWGVIGSNENGLDLAPFHKNINWGLNPDESFEDNPELLGVDYCDDSHVKIKAVPSLTATEIREAILEVPHGVVYDFSKRKTKHKLKEGYSRINIGVSGSSNEPEDTEALEDFGHKIARITKLLYVGTERGGPGCVLRGASPDIEESIVVRPMDENHRTSDIMHRTGIDNLQVLLYGANKGEHRKVFSEKTDVHIILNGKSGTLEEAMYTIDVGKPVVILASSPVATHVLSTPALANLPNVHIARDLDEATKLVTEYANQRRK